MVQVRPGTVEEEEEELEERLQTVAYSEVGSRTVEVKGQDGKAVELDPDASLITDFTVITDLRVSVLISGSRFCDKLVQILCSIQCSHQNSYMVLMFVSRAAA